jgi:hypothetical protein
MKQHIECECGQKQHLINLTLDADPGQPPFLDIHIQMNHYLGFFKRVWVAIKYIFGSTSCKNLHWDCIVLGVDQAKQMNQIISTFIFKYNEWLTEISVKK